MHNSGGIIRLINKTSLCPYQLLMLLFTVHVITLLRSPASGLESVSQLFYKQVMISSVLQTQRQLVVSELTQSLKKINFSQTLSICCGQISFYPQQAQQLCAALWSAGDISCKFPVKGSGWKPTFKFTFQFQLLILGNFRLTSIRTKKKTRFK